MNLKEYLEQLNKFAEDNPEALEFTVVSSMDDEGNGFNRVHYSPSKGFYEDDEFTSVENYEDYGIDDSETNAVCIN